MANVTVNLGSSNDASESSSLVDRPFLRPMVVRKNSGKGAGVEKVAFVAKDGEAIVVTPAGGSKAAWVGRKNADKHYEFVRYLSPDESVTISGAAA